MVKSSIRAFATDISLIAYLFTNIEKVSVSQTTLVLLGLLVVTVGILYINKKAMKKIDSLENL